jgi:hypothetical protein
VLTVLQDFRALDFVRFLEAFPLGHASGAIKALAALTAPVGAIRQEEKDPKFQKASAPGAMHMVAATHGTSSVHSIQKQAKNAFHAKRMIAPSGYWRNHPARLCPARLFCMADAGVGSNQNDASTCIA